MNDEEIIADFIAKESLEPSTMAQGLVNIMAKSMQKARADEGESFAQWLEASRNWLSFEDRGQEAITKKINQLRALAQSEDGK